MTLLFIGIIVLAGIFRIIHLWFTVKFTFACGADLCEKLYKVTLSQSYSKFLKLNSSSIISGMAKIDVAVNALSQMIRLISSFFLIISIIATLLYINTAIALFCLFFFGFGYISINITVRSRIQNNSVAIAANKTKTIKFSFIKPLNNI